MDLGPYTLQVFISLILILGAACVALICDFLKGNNEKLRELTIELKVRREEEQRRVDWMMPYVLATPEGRAAAGVVVNEVEAEPNEAQEPQPAELFEVPQLVPNPPQAIPEEVLLKAMSVQAGPVAVPQRVASKTDWNQLLTSKRAARTAAESPLLTAVMEATATDSGLPAGFLDPALAAQLIAKKQRVSGLVMSIGSTAAPDSALRLVQSLLGSGDFATQPAPGEFFLIFPNERGAAAQRRLSQVAQQLWNFQLHSSEEQVMFSWGGLEVRNELFQEAMASAAERMQESRRNRA